MEALSHLMAVMLRFQLFLCMLVSAGPALHAAQFRAVLEARYHTPVHAEITSTVVDISKEMGESFQEGELLMRLDDRVYVANSEKAAAILARAQAGLEAQERLYNDGVASLVELRETQANFGIAKADWVIAQKDLDACTIQAPYDGQVQDVHVEWYQRVEPGMPLMDLLDDSVLVAKLLIPARYVDQLSVGGKLQLAVTGKNKRFVATVTHIAPAIDPSSSLVQIHADLDNTDHQLRAGMVGAVEMKDGLNERYEEKSSSSYPRP